MSDGAYSQHVLNPYSPIDKINPDRVTIEISSTFDAEHSKINIVERRGGTISDVVVARASGEKYLKIHCDMIVTLVITEKSWRWSARYDAVTTKNPYDEYYGALEYLPDNAILHADGRGDIVGYRTISFHARKSVTGRQGSLHSFSFNIDLLQAGDISRDPTGQDSLEPSKAVWLSITIDPDVQNPPNNGGPGLVGPSFFAA